MGRPTLAGGHSAHTHPLRTGALAAAVLVVLAGMAGCGETPQSATVRKVDAAPAQGSGAPAYMAQGWKAGDATSWGAHLKARSQSQNEYVRLGAR